MQGVQRRMILVGFFFRIFESIFFFFLGGGGGWEICCCHMRPRARYGGYTWSMLIANIWTPVLKYEGFP